MNNYVRFYNLLPLDQRKLYYEYTGASIVFDKILKNNYSISSFIQHQSQDDLINKHLTIIANHKIQTLCPSSYDLMNKQKRRVLNLLAKLSRNKQDKFLRKQIDDELLILKNMINDITTYNQNTFNYIITLY